jgi:tripartite-type tricarboxylate transporter receptor subunit TctC
MAMADYYSLISHAVARLDKSTGETRRALYDRARAAQLNQLRKIDPPLTDLDFERERLALEDAIRRVESVCRVKLLISVDPRSDSASDDAVAIASREKAKMPKRWMVLVAALVVAGITFASIKRPQVEQWPSRPLTMIVPFAAGGPTDVVGRILAERLSHVLGQKVVVENVGGAGGMTGAQRVALASPDGYQALLGTVGTQAYNQTLYKKPLYNAVDDFTPVVLIAEQPLVLVVPKDFPTDSLKSFTAYVKANAPKLAFGSGGSGSATHLGCVLLNTAIGVNVQHVPYRGSAPAMQDLIAGRISYLCDAVSTSLPHIKSGTVKAIAVLARHRSAVLPDVPTAAEQGLAGFEANNWIGLFFPRETPEPIIRQLHDAAIKAMNVPALRVRMETIGTDLVTPDRTSTDYLKHFVSGEIEKWAAPIKASGVSVD